ncbi:MAG: hypothetical protein QM793_01630 [Muricomes sp.]
MSRLETQNKNGRKKRKAMEKSTIALLAAAVVLLAASALGSTRAALTYFSENYTAQMAVYDIGVTLTENGKDISNRDYQNRDDLWDENQGVLLENMLDETDGKLMIGRNYEEKLAVRNSGTIDEYVRVRIYKYWTDESGNKILTLSPDLIQLNLTGNGWIEDQVTEERTVLYYPGILASGETAPDFADKIKIDNKIASMVKQTRTTDGNGLTTITTTYKYDGVQFNLEAEVDAVQTHNAADAIKSAWGVDVNVSPDGQLSLQ